MQTKAIYTAPWPKELENRSQQAATTSSLSSICNPWRIVKALQASCSNIIAQRLASTTLKKIEEHREELFQNPQFSQVVIDTADGATIYGAFAKGSIKKVILFAPGLNDCYEMLNDNTQVPPRFFKLFRNMLGDISIMVINRRGVGQKNSVMPTPEGVAIDVYSAARFLIDKEKFTPKDLIIWGHSFGGMSGTKGATLLQGDFPDEEISLVADRSFLSMAKFFEEYIGDMIKGKIAGLFIKFAQWDMKSDADFSIIKGKKIIIYSQIDETVRYAASIHKLTMELTIAQMIPFKMRDDVPSDWHHVRELVASEQGKLAFHLKECLHMEKPVS